MTVKSPKISSIEQARQALRPVEPEFEKKELTTFFPKDSIFTKIKTYLSKKKDESGQEKEFEADWRNINVSANHIVLFKGVALSKSQLVLFDKGARAHYLEDRKKAPTVAQIKKAEAEAKKIESLRQTREDLLMQYDLFIDDDSLFETLGEMKNDDWDKLVTDLEKKAAEAKEKE